jgi:hypothetical protein
METEEKRYCDQCGYDLADYEFDETVCGACLSAMQRGKRIYFVVAVDLETQTKSIDDRILVDRFTEGPAFDCASGLWTKETDEEYLQALEILNNPEWEKE